MEKWKTGVRVVRGESLERAIARAGGRATAIDFAGIGGTKTWIGAVKMPADAVTGAHHHGRHEVAIYMTSGHLEIRWGDRLDYSAEIGPGDFAYFEPFVPHQERNLSRREPAAYLAIRSDNERIAVPLDVAPVEPPEEMFAD